MPNPALHNCPNLLRAHTPTLPYYKTIDSHLRGRAFGHSVMLVTGGYVV